MDLKIEQTPVDRLIPYARNARTHSDEQIAQIAGSIVEFVRRRDGHRAAKRHGVGDRG